MPVSATLAAAVAQAADTVDPAEHVTVLAGEPDNGVLEGAAAGRTDLIVTGDKAMQELGSFRGIPIVSAAQFRDTTPAAKSHRATRPELQIAVLRTPVSRRGRASERPQTWPGRRPAEHDHSH